MAPTIRTHTTTRRGNRAGYQEHDDFEGLPVRQWRQEWVNITPPPQVETTQKNDVWAIELPHGMPKDSNLLPTHTQELLRAARSGRLYKRTAPAEEEEADADAGTDKPEKKEEEDPGSKGYMVKVWKQIPRNAEGPTISHLAKRRKGTVTLSASLPTGTTSGPTVTKATVRRIDAAGNPYNQTVILTAGQPVDGEIISTTVVQAPTANLNADGSVATPVRRRPPPPKRKAKGPGRGRKKKLPLPLPGPSVGQPGAPGAPGTAVGEGGVKLEGAADGIKQEDGDDGKNQDSEMADGDDDDEDGDDDGEDGEDGEEGDEEDGELADSEKGTPARQEDSVDPEIKNSPSVDPPIITTPAATTSDAMDISADEPPTAMPPVQPATLITSPPFEGSPLKNVSVPFSPTDAAVPNLPETPPAAAPDTSATEPIPAESADLETVAPEPQSDVPSDPIPSPILSVEVLEAPVVEAIIEEPTFVEPEVPVDTEMIDAASPQPELVVESQMTPPTEDDNGPAIIEEIIETVKSPPNDEVHPPSESTSPMGDDGVPEPVQSPIVEQPTVVHTIQITEVEEHSAVPIVNIPVADTGITATDIGSITLPALKPLQTEEPGTVPEEIVPESPDLLGGLEAALDRHSEPPAVLAAPVPENLPSNEAE